MKITTAKQFETLVSQMESHPSYAKGFRKGIKPLNFDHFWSGIAGKLNALGPPVSDADGWHKVWKDMKFKVKKKLMTNKTEARATGGGLFNHVPLSPLEQTVANIMQFEKQINPSGNEIGFGGHEEVETLAITEEERNITSESAQNIEISVESSTLEIPSVSKKMRTSSNNKTEEKERIRLLKKQTEVQQQKCSHLESIKGYLKDISRYQRKRLQLKEERFDAYKKKHAKKMNF